MRIKDLKIKEPMNDGKKMLDMNVELSFQTVKIFIKHSTLIRPIQQKNIGYKFWTP